MNLRSQRALRGPNIWSQVTVLEVQLDFTEDNALAVDSLAALQDRLLALLPAVNSPVADEGLDENPLRNQPVSQLSPEMQAALFFARSAVQLQTLAGSEVSFARVAKTNEPKVFQVAIQYREEPVGRMAVAKALELLRAAAAGESFPTSDVLDELRSLDQQIRLGPSTGSIVRAAVNRGIPFRRLNERSLVQLGYACRQHRILAAETDKTSAIAETIVQDKELTKQLLKSIGVPVPEGRPVTSAEDAWAAAQEIGSPVVVKPQDGNQGRGVAVNLVTREQVMAAYAAAFEVRDDILVEKFAPGQDYRLLVIGNRLIAAARREPPQVIGDGRRPITELVAEVNLDPRRGEDHATPLSKIPIDEIAIAVLADQGLTPTSVPAAGQQVLLRRNANLSTGGTAADVTDLVHPEVTARVIDAVRMVGLDIAGVDVVCSDISRPLEHQGGVIVEINAAPGLRMHLEPSAGKARPVGEAIVETMFAPGDTGRIPIVSVTGVNGKTTTTRLIAHLLRVTGRKVGMTCTDGVYLNDRRIDTGDCSGPKSARTVLANPIVEAAVLETARGGILREGLGFDFSDVSVVTNIGEGDHLGMNGIDTIEQLARVKRVIIENVGPQGYGVLNADDPLTVAMAEYCPGKVIYFSRSADNPVLQAHRHKGQRVVFVQNSAIIVAEGTWEVRVAPLRDVPLTVGGLVGFQVENVMAAVAAAWGLGIPFEQIRTGLESFTSDVKKAPARFNVIEAHGATIVIDYGHNSSALLALVEAFNQMPHTRRRIVYTAAGDRRDIDIIRQSQVIADHFDEIVVYEDQCTRGRQDGEVIRLMREGLAEGRRLASILETRGEMVAIDMVLQRMEAGDLILVQADQVDAAIAFVHKWITDRALANPQAPHHNPRTKINE